MGLARGQGFFQKGGCFREGEEQKGNVRRVGSTVGGQRNTCPHPFLTSKSVAADPSHLSLGIHRELLETNEMNLRSAIYQL